MIDPLTIQEIKAGLNPQEGFLLVYIRFSNAPVHKTIEVSEEIAADVDREGRPIGLEIVKTFPTLSSGIIRGSFSSREIQEVIEKNFGVSLPDDQCSVIPWLQPA